MHRQHDCQLWQELLAGPDCNEVEFLSAVLAAVLDCVHKLPVPREPASVRSWQANRATRDLPAASLVRLAVAGMRDIIRASNGLQQLNEVSWLLQSGYYLMLLVQKRKSTLLCIYEGHKCQHCAESDAGMTGQALKI